MTTPAKWYEIKALAKGDDKPKAAEVFIYGNIGDRWNEDGVIASEFVRDISALDVESITLRINSYGGSVPDGLAIYNALVRHKAVVDVHIDGVAISCAGYIAMAGNTVSMAENAQLMIHAPWSFAVGNAVEMRQQADILDRYARAMASAYAGKSGQSVDECLALLTDGKDHWYSAAEAKDGGFADAITDTIAIAASLASSFDLSRFISSAASSAITPKESVIMPDAIKEPVVVATPHPSVPFARTKEMNTQVLAFFQPFLLRDGVQALQAELLADPALTVEQIQARLLTHIGKDAAPANPSGAHPRIEVVEDEVTKRREAVSAAIRVRAGVASEKERSAIAGNPFRGAKLLDIARSSLERASIRHQGMGQMEVVAAAFTQSTSDFPILLENTMHKTLLSAYALAAYTWTRFCMRGSVSDFRAHNRYRTGSFGNLEAVNQLGEFKNKSIPDGEKATITATTKGNIVNLSRQAIINDDLGAFVGLSNSLGRAAARTVEADVYATLALNAGLGPTLNDGLTLFHATHLNITTGAAITMAAIDADRVAMASQKDVGGNDFLDLRPEVLLLPIGLGGTARTINQAVYDPDTANKLQKPNQVLGLFRDIVDSPRLTGTRRYLFADPMQAPVLEVAFLDGNDQPWLELQNGFDVDGARYKVRLDYGVAGIDWRGAVTNAGV